MQWAHFPPRKNRNRTFLPFFSARFHFAPAVSARLKASAGKGAHVNGPNVFKSLTINGWPSACQPSPDLQLLESLDLLLFLFLERLELHLKIAGSVLLELTPGFRDFSRSSISQYLVCQRFAYLSISFLYFCSASRRSSPSLRRSIRSAAAAISSLNAITSGSFELFPNLLLPRSLRILDRSPS